MFVKQRLFVLGTMAALILMFGCRGENRQVLCSDDCLLLLVPDDHSLTDPLVTVWQDAGDEEGLHVRPIHDSDLLKPFSPSFHFAGMIVPDSIHQRMGDAFLAMLRRYVSGGGRLMVVYDAATLSLQGRYPSKWSRLSDLVGISYGLYETLQGRTIEWATPTGDASLVQQLDIPPGKYYPFNVTQTGLSGPVSSGEPNQGDFAVQLRRYKYGDLHYPSFVTVGAYAGRTLLRSHAGVVAGEHDYGKGRVLFINLPLGYLKANTDGLLLHVFLKYFSVHCVGLPYLLQVPDGIGGLVLNWHVDSNAAIEPLQELATWSLARQGPYSIHITAGPDDMHLGDHRGFDLDHNVVSRQLVHAYASLGHEIGSHGGWAHDYFASHVDQDSPDRMKDFLALNKDSVERATGIPVTSYSAPNGNQPPWVTAWLESHGFVAYYFTGDTGMGPTQGYRNGNRSSLTMWAFPVVHLDKAAAFEEMTKDGYPTSEVASWLVSLTAFVSDHHVARLIYFHPPGVLPYHAAVDTWMAHTSELASANAFRWYTMSGLAHFLDKRKETQWTSSISNRVLTINATHPETLAHLGWSMPTARYSRPAIIDGSGVVYREKEAWFVIASSCTHLRFSAQMVEEQ